MTLRIAYVGPFAYPASSADSLRIKGITHALVASGCTVSIVAASRGSEDLDSPSSLVKVTSVDEFPDPKDSAVRRALRALSYGDKTADFVAKHAAEFDVVLLYANHLAYVLRLSAVVRRFHIPLIVDSVEWYDSRHLPGGRFGPLAMSYAASMYLATPRADGVIAISRLLQRHYSNHACPTIRIPPLFQVAPERPPQFNTDGRMHLCYSGSPGAKDDICGMLRALAKLGYGPQRVCFHVVGLTRDELTSWCERASLAGGALDASVEVRCYGRVPNTRAREIVSSSDYLLLLRQIARFSMAGFPSKVAEAMCMGTPVISNLTSDLDQILLHRQNALVVRDASEAGLRFALDEALELSGSELLTLKKQALRTATERFDPSAYSSALNAFIHARVLGHRQRYS